MKAGYANSVKDAEQMDVRTVLQALAYEQFLGDYESAYIEINREG